MGTNKVILVGHLGREPELKYVGANSMPLCKLSVATNDRRRNENGDYVEYTEWHNLVVFGKTAENCATYLHKGGLIYAEGKIKTNRWLDNQGKERFSTEILVSSVEFLGNSRKGVDKKSSEAIADGAIELSQPENDQPALHNHQDSDGAGVEVF